MTIETLSRLDTNEALPVDIIREQAGLPPLAKEERGEAQTQTGGWVLDPLTHSSSVIRENIGSPLFDEVSAAIDLKPDWWWDEKFAHITAELHEEIEVEHLEQLSADIISHSVNPASVELTEDDMAPAVIEAMVDYEAPLVAGQHYDEERGWHYQAFEMDEDVTQIVQPFDDKGVTQLIKVPRETKWRRFWHEVAEFIRSYR